MRFLSQILLVTGLVIAAEAVCDPEWVSQRGAGLVSRNGVIAGNFKPGVPSYIGVGKTRKGFVPGRIQTEHPAGLYYTVNMKVERTTTEVEFLKNNDNQNFTWVDGSGEKCLGDAIVVDEVYYIGRYVENGFTYIGRVDIGQKGLRYENAAGMEVLTNSYEVLVCHEKQEDCGDPQDKIELERCEKDLAASDKNMEKLQNDFEEKKYELNECKRSLREVQQNNTDLINEIKKIQGKSCSENFYDIDERFGPNKPHSQVTSRPTLPPNQPIFDCENDPKTLQLRLDLANERARCRQERSNFESQIAKLRYDLQQSTQQRKALENNLNELTFRVIELETENRNLKEGSCSGVDGCERALRSHGGYLTQDDKNRLIRAIIAKLPGSEAEKFN